MAFCALQPSFGMLNALVQDHEAYYFVEFLEKTFLTQLMVV